MNTTTGLADQIEAYRIGFIATRVCAILERLEKKQPHHQKDFGTLSEGAELMSQIASGSLLVENKESVDGLAPSLDGLSVLGSALLVLKQLGSDIEEKENISSLFIHYRTCLKGLSGGGVAEAEDLVALKNFFKALSKLIQNDIKSERFRHTSTQNAIGVPNGYISAHLI